MWFSIRHRYAPDRNIERVRVLIVEDEPYMAEAIRDGYAWKRSRPTSPVTVTPQWNC
jgi:hypothetical protein